MPGRWWVGRHGGRAGLNPEGRSEGRGGALIAGAFLLVAVLAVAACGPADGSPAAGSPSASPEGAGSFAPDACLIETPPGPADEPPIPDAGGGRAALCLVGPPAVQVEGTAWCTWTPDRIAVTEVSLVPTPTDDGAWEATLQLRDSVLQVASTATDGTVTTWAQADVDAIVATDGTDGLAAFDAELVVDAESSPPPATPPRVAGVLRWQCADPPPPGE